MPVATLDSFFEHVLYSNPFAVNRVALYTPAREDAPQVHHKQFTQLVELANKAHEQQLGYGAMLWGEAGIGKSHLLARLGNWAGSDHRHALFVYITNLQAEPEQLPRSLLRCVVSILTRGRTGHFSRTPLYRMLNATIRHALQDDGTRSYSWAAAEAAYEELVDHLCDRGPGHAAVVDRRTYRVLFEFFRASYVGRDQPDDALGSLAVRWLGGEFLDPDEARKLSIPLGSRGQEPVGLTDDEEIKKALVTLAQMAFYNQRPLLLCFDQVDNLEPEQFSALARFLHALLDSAGNLLVITCGVRATMTTWQTGVVQDSTWDRLAQQKVELQRISVIEAKEIVQARLQPFQEPFLAVDEIKQRIEKDYLFPLGQGWSGEFLGNKVDLRPRDVINWANEGWRRRQAAIKERGGQAWLQSWDGTMPPGVQPAEPSEDEIQQQIDNKVTLKLQEHTHQRRLEPHTLPADGDNLAGLLHAVLQRCLPTLPALTQPGSPSQQVLRVERQVRPRYGQRPPYDLILHERNADGKETKTGLLCLVVANRTSMAAFLKRLAQDAQPPDRIFLITDRAPSPEPGKYRAATSRSASAALWAAPFCGDTDVRSICRAGCVAGRGGARSFGRFRD
jgi:hypothetical protein